MALTPFRLNDRRFLLLLADVVAAVPKGLYTAAKETIQFASKLSPGNLVGAAIGDEDLQAAATSVADALPDAPQAETPAGKMLDSQARAGASKPASCSITSSVPRGPSSRYSGSTFCQASKKRR